MQKKKAVRAADGAGEEKRKKGEKRRGGTGRCGRKMPARPGAKNALCKNREGQSHQEDKK